MIEVPEEQIDPLSTISGSGPAYVYLLIEEFTKAAVGKGFTEPEARLMVEQTFIGATALLEASGEDPAELRRRVTSPKGTTERAVAVLQDAHLDELSPAPPTRPSRGRRSWLPEPDRAPSRSLSEHRRSLD